jgi:Family of unknown function (DUF6455)
MVATPGRRGEAIMPTSTVKNDHATYPYRMMERLGIEPGGGVLPRLSLRYSTVVRGCKDCPATQACGAWLDRAAPTGRPPRFCPNADILFELQLDQPGRG